MDNKQTIALAGLIKYSDSEQVTKDPVLIEHPYCGAYVQEPNNALTGYQHGNGDHFDTDGADG